MTECGTSRKYRTGCRCDLCRKAQSDRQKLYRNSNIEKRREIERKKAKQYRANNPEKYASVQKQYRTSNPEKIAEYNKLKRGDGRQAKNKYLRKYGITHETSEFLFNHQLGSCAICNSVFTGLYDRFTHRDHCHTTGVFRGFLCNKCNSLLGLLEKINLNIQPFKDYLANPPAKKALGDTNKKFNY